MKGVDSSVQKAATSPSTFASVAGLGEAYLPQIAGTMSLANVADGHMEGTQATGTLIGMAEMNRPLLQAALPDLSAEVAAGLRADGSLELAAQVAELEIWDQCGCSDSFCTSFYVGPRPVGAWSDEGEHDNESPEVERGMVVLDVVDGRIRYIEVLDRPEIRAALENAVRQAQ